ncbi:MAG: CAP domain-containing protein [Hyellaceae cyanobacterium CSU_1_1]|nr:CAP domain-containing protein [Hyellaceae cyanobacterium CSU_1_1]
MSSQLINQVLELTNAERAKAGLKPLTLNNRLTQAAQGHSDSMAADDFFSHTGVDGSDVSDRVQDTGYQYSYTGENIAAGQKTAAEVVQGWMDSPGHRANILNADYTEIGIGYELLENDSGSVNYHHYWTQVFGTPQGNSNQPNPPQEQNSDPITGKDDSGDSTGNSSDLESPNLVDTAKNDSATTSSGSKDNLTGTSGDSLMAGDDDAVNFPDNEASSDKNQFDF